MTDRFHGVLCGHLACRVRLARMLRGWSQKELAIRARLYPATIRRMEKGIGQPTEQTVAAVREVLGLEECDA